jgi:hypothetical protein
MDLFDDIAAIAAGAQVKIALEDAVKAYKRDGVTRVLKLWRKYVAVPRCDISADIVPRAALENMPALMNEHSNTYISNDYQSLLSLESFHEGYNDWSSNEAQPKPHEEVLPAGQMSLPRLSDTFAPLGISKDNENTNATYQEQQQQQQDLGQKRGSRSDGMLSLVSLLGTGMHMDLGALKPSRPPQRTRRRSRAEQMISDVERLYEFGVSLSLSPKILHCESP